jgi:hypothetical protein
MGQFAKLQTHALQHARYCRILSFEKTGLSENGEQMTAYADQATIMIVVGSIVWQGARHRTPETGKES